MREIMRVMRRICLLAEIDRADEASRVAVAVLDPLISAYREAHGAESLPDERLREIQSHEQERASNAAALGEMLFPLLAEHIDGLRPTSGRAGHTHPGPEGPAEGPRRRPAASPEIADLLDGILAQEGSRPPSRPRRARPKPSPTPSP